VSYRTRLARPINYVLRPMRVQLVRRTSADPVIHCCRSAPTSTRDLPSRAACRTPSA
jgi:hypothetical protein